MRPSDLKALPRSTVSAPTGTIPLRAPGAFGQIFATTTSISEEMRREVDVGWVVPDERQVKVPRRGPSSEEELIPGIGGLRVGGVLGYEPGASVTSCIVGDLRDDVHSGSRSSTVTDRQ